MLVVTESYCELNCWICCDNNHSTGIFPYLSIRIRKSILLIDPICIKLSHTYWSKHSYCIKFKIATSLHVIANRYGRLYKQIALNSKDTKKTVPARPEESCKEAIVLWVKLKHEVFFKMLDLHLQLSRKRFESVDTRPDLRVLLCISHLDMESMGQLVEIDYVSRINDFFSSESDHISINRIHALRMKTFI